jgi:capsular exopolysaccharide synthesis family protein
MAPDPPATPLSRIMTEAELTPPPADNSLTLAEPGSGRECEITAEEIRMVSQPRGQIAEQFRNLRNSIAALNPDGAPRTVVLTSAIAGEGKTVAAVNLAVAMAELPGKQVLLVDADLHHPGIEGYLGQERHQGFSDVLRGKCALDGAIRATSVDGLSVMGAGTLPDNPSKLLGSERTRVVLNMLKQRFSYVLIDTPEALSISDASMLGAMADGILLVVRLGYTAKHLVEQTHNQLETLGGNVLGTCLTGGDMHEAVEGVSGR